VLAAALAIFVIVSSTSTEKQNKTVDTRLTTVQVTQDGLNLSFAGFITGEPFDSGTVQLDQVLSAPLRVGETIQIDGNMVANFENGSIRANYQVDGVGKRDGSLEVDGEGEITDGTGDFENATGDITFTGSRPNLEEPQGTFFVKGDVEYEGEE
jgi:hypothetical protein